MENIFKVLDNEIGSLNFNVEYYKTKCNEKDEEIEKLKKEIEQLKERISNDTF